MNTIFTIPILFSKTVPDRLIPLVCKLVERNIAVNYRKVFEDAIIINLKREDLFRLRKFIPMESKLINSDDNLIETDSRVKDEVELRVRKEALTNTISEIQRKIERIDNDIEKYRIAQGGTKSRERDIRNAEAEKKEHLKALKKYYGLLVDTSGKHAMSVSDLNKTNLDDIKQIQKDSANFKNRTERLKYELELKKYKKEVAEKEKNKYKIDSTSITNARTASLDAVEIPPGVILYKDISLEPTMLEIAVNDRKYFIGLKSIPYKIDNDSDIIRSLMVDAQGGVINTMRRVLKTYWNSVLRHSLGKAAHIYRGRPVSSTVSQAMNTVFGGKNIADEPLDDLYFSPSVFDLSKAKRVANMMKDSSPVWSTELCVTTTDVEDAGVDLEYFYKIYRRATKVGWGDIIFIDREQEIVSHCSMSLLACTKISFSNLQKLFNLENVIDFSQLSRYAKGPFSANTMPFRTFMKKFGK
jgi:hypothetical protein